jgi:hypothetical protein
MIYGAAFPAVLSGLIGTHVDRNHAFAHACTRVSIMPSRCDLDQRDFNSPIPPLHPAHFT